MDMDKYTDKPPIHDDTPPGYNSIDSTEPNPNLYQPPAVGYDTNEQHGGAGSPVKPVTFQPGSTGGPDPTVYIYNNVMHPRGIQREWSTPITACCADPGICLIKSILPCSIACTAVDMGESMCLPCCVPFALLPMRSLFRGRHNIQGNLINDCVVSSCCYACTECQLSRELKLIKSGKVLP